MRQYFDIKKNYSDTIVLFQVGDFYELFFDDAKIVAACLGIALTKRGTHQNEPIPLCGVPVHAIDFYLSKLIKLGHKVALCQQLEVAKPGKVVDRGVTQVITPGTVTDMKLLDAKSASYLFSLVPGPDHWGLLFGELLTAQLYATSIPAQSEKSFEAELTRFFPDEIIVPNDQSADQAAQLCKRMGYFVTRLADDTTTHESYEQWIAQQFSRDIQQHLSTDRMLNAATYYFWRYVQHTNKSAIDQFKTLHVYNASDYLILDRSTQRNLELIANTQEGGSKYTLFESLDGAVTPM